MRQQEFISPALSSPEGPVLLDNGDFLVVEMGADAGTVSRIDTKTGHCVRIVRTGRPNGLAVDASGVVWTAESEHPSLLKVFPDGKTEVVLEGCDGVPFLFPNDLAFGSDGMLYMTDSGIKFENFSIDGEIRSDYATAFYNGKVFCIDPVTLKIELIDDGIKFANGIAIGPDDLLYVNETITGNIYRYARIDGKYAGRTRQLFGNVIHDDGKVYYRGPDGMKFSASGNLYCTVFGQGDVVVLGRNGKVVDSIVLGGKCPTNLVFGPEGSGDIYVTEGEKGRLEVHHVGEDGFALYR